MNLMMKIIKIHFKSFDVSLIARWLLSLKQIETGRMRFHLFISRTFLFFYLHLYLIHVSFIAVGN